MKSLLVTTFLLFFAAAGFSQSWTPAQLQAAGTADATDLSAVEKDIFRYINLARLYPQDFARLEAAEYTVPTGFTPEAGFDAYKHSLLQELRTRKPVAALQPDAALQVSARCFAEEQGRTGATGHLRKSCTQPSGAFGECNSYGLAQARDVVVQWLIDTGIPTVGHRLNCLNGRYTRLGVRTGPHKEWRTVTVADFGW